MAAEFFAAGLAAPEARPAREFLQARGFDRDAAQRFGVGFAPDSWDGVMRHLRGRGFTEAEIIQAGLASQGQRGAYDRFRGRIMWPIRDLTGGVIGFGARKCLESDQGPKYLNTPETGVYHKAQVLYGVDLAKREIGRQREVVIVEGYTDVMAVHLAGMTTAVATCGTAFGEDHVRVVRRLLGDGADGAAPGRVVFTFDGDDAGRQAAMRAFEQDQAFYANTFVAVAPDGMDPCELRLSRGDDAVRNLVRDAVPMFKFAILTVLGRLNLDTPEGRVTGLGYAAPVVARLRSTSLRAEYARLLAGWLGLPEAQVAAEVARASSRPRRGGPAEPPGQPRERIGAARQGRADSVARLEYSVLMAVLQAPEDVPDSFDILDGEAFVTPELRAIHDAVRAAGGIGAAHELPSASVWVERVLEAAPSVVAGRVTELAVVPLPVQPLPPQAVVAGEEVNKRRDYVRGVVARLREAVVTRQIAQVKAQMGRSAALGDAAQQRSALERLQALEEERRLLRYDP
jgi:DNA primase